MDLQSDKMLAISTLKYRIDIMICNAESRGQLQWSCPLVLQKKLAKYKIEFTKLNKEELLEKVISKL